eukprot:CAMPEP_0204259278 /NCGR_PEP_ID=MMETSP0468-20130131/5537_1 /ASSEMBLY_ACC=CAM_ASM_000383 /TAXON_ID=2969 /ORGANISM="Oxyrrhis marina" /LENGTH=104 /DNA_ID=CAMNT_0051233553 /DNA_START=469 /DNA_END=783 /DNA_ORIENTATION=-
MLQTRKTTRSSDTPSPCTHGAALGTSPAVRSLMCGNTTCVRLSLALAAASVGVPGAAGSAARPSAPLPEPILRDLLLWTSTAASNNAKTPAQDTNTAAMGLTNA